MCNLTINKQKKLCLDWCDIEFITNGTQVVVILSSGHAYSWQIEITIMKIHTITVWVLEEILQGMSKLEQLHQMPPLLFANGFSSQ